MLKAYKYRLQPNRKQRLLLEKTLDTCRGLYNMCLEQRIYNRCTRFQQQAELPALKVSFPEYKEVHSQVLQSVLDRLDKSYQAFFRRLKSGQRAGFPRFKGKTRYDSFHYPQAGFSMSGTYVQLSKVGNIKLRLSRDIPEGATIKNCTVKRDGCGSWYVSFIAEVEPNILPHSDAAIGIDVGIANYAALSNGEFIPNPRFYQSAQTELRRVQRRVARRVKGSNRRRKAVHLLSKLHQRITNRRMDFLHKQTTSLIQRFGTIVIENLNVAGMAKGNLAKQIHDASWGQFYTLLKQKAAEAMREIVEVNPAYTSQTCPICQHVSRDNRKTQSAFLCVECGYSAHADTNGAVNILGRVVPSFANVGAVMLA